MKKILTLLGLAIFAVPVGLDAVTFGPRVQQHTQALSGAPSAATSSAVSAEPLRLIAEGPDVAVLQARLEPYGLPMHRHGSSLRIDVFPHELGFLAGDEHVTIDLGRKLYPMLDVSVPALGVNAPIREARNGNDVLIAILDTGTDFTHPDFLNPDGSTRFVAYWDQTATPRNGGEFGVVCEAVEINRVVLLDDRDACPNNADEPLAGFFPSGHGTHVAGIAAGGDELYRGVAPGAMLIGVRMTFEEAGLVDAIAWSVEVAALFGKPLVVNLSLGANDAGHDGFAPSEQIIDELSRAGVIMVAAAGNERSHPIHVGAEAASDEHRAEFETTGLVNPEEFHIEAWSAEGEDFRVAIAMADAQGTVLDQSPFLAYGAFAALEPHVLQDEGKEVAELVALPQTTPVGAGIRMRLTGLDGSLRSYTWHLVWESPGGQFDAWLTDRVAAFATDVSGPQVVTFAATEETDTVTFVPGDVEQTVTLPGSAREAITVTGFVSRKTWPTVDGESAESTSDSQLGELLDIASIGPTRDGRIKPDVAAPGEFIVSSLATTLDGDFISSLQKADEEHWVQRGTSMASPHVAGVIALLLEQNDMLTPEDLKALFRELAVRDDETGDLPNTRWGDGKLLLDGVQTTQAWQTATRNDTTGPEITNLEIRRTGGGMRLTWYTDEPASAFVLAGDEQFTVQSFGLRHEIQVNSTFSGDLAVVAIDPRGNTSETQMIAVPGGGCGCYAGNTGGSPIVAVLLAFVGWWILRQTKTFVTTQEGRGRPFLP